MADNLIIGSNQFSSNVDEKHFDIVASALRKSCLNDDELKDYFELERCFKCITKFEMQSFGNSKDNLNSDIFVKVERWTNLFTVNSEIKRNNTKFYLVQLIYNLYQEAF